MNLFRVITIRRPQVSQKTCLWDGRWLFKRIHLPFNLSCFISYCVFSHPLRLTNICFVVDYLTLRQLVLCYIVPVAHFLFRFQYWFPSRFCSDYVLLLQPSEVVFCYWRHHLHLLVVENGKKNFPKEEIRLLWDTQTISSSKLAWTVEVQWHGNRPADTMYWLGVYLHIPDTI